MVSRENTDFKNLYKFAFFINIKYILENRKRSMVHIIRSNQCLKFSFYELHNFDSGIYVCQIFFGHKQPVNHLFYDKLYHESTGAQ